MARDSRYFDLERAQRLEGLPAALAALSDRPMKADDAERWARLYRGYVWELGRLLGSPATTGARGLDAGRALLAALLDDNSESQRRPHAPIRHEEWQQIKSRMNAPGMTCARLLNMLKGTSDEITKRRESHSLPTQAA